MEPVEVGGYVVEFVFDFTSTLKLVRFELESARVLGDRSTHVVGESVVCCSVYLHGYSDDGVGAASGPMIASAMSPRSRNMRMPSSEIRP